MNILVTGASGFVGRVLCTRLLGEGGQVRGAVWIADAGARIPAGVDAVSIDSMGPNTDWSAALVGIHTVIHLAARVHVMHDTVNDPLIEYRRVNVEGTLNLARHAADAGVRRFVFISSIKINGEGSAAPYSETSKVQPTDPYAVSKWEAEQGLRRIEFESGIEVVVVRSPLVYGPGVKANFLNLLRVVHRGIPLPLASISNKRSLIYVDNLADALATCANHPAAAGRTFLVSDGEDVSSPELIRRMAATLGVPVRLFSVPAAFLRLAGRLTGKAAAVNRLVGSLQVDSSEIRRVLAWTPPISLKEGLEQTVTWYRQQLEGI